MSGLKAYLLVSLFSVGSFIYQFIKFENYDHVFIMTITVILASIIGSSTQIAQKNSKYHIRGKEIIAIYMVGFLFAYLAFIIGDTFYHNQTPEDAFIFNKVHLAGLITIISSYLNIRLLEAVKGIILAVLRVAVNSFGNAVINTVKQFMKEKE